MKEYYLHMPSEDGKGFAYEGIRERVKYGNNKDIDLILFNSDEVVLVETTAFGRPKAKGLIEEFREHEKNIRKKFNLGKRKMVRVFAYDYGDPSRKDMEALEKDGIQVISFPELFSRYLQILKKLYQEPTERSGNEEDPMTQLIMFQAYTIGNWEKLVELFSPKLSE